MVTCSRLYCGREAGNYSDRGHPINLCPFHFEEACLADMAERELAAIKRKRDMFEYKVEVLAEQGGSSQTYIIKSGIELSDKQLRVAGLILDGGVSDEQLDELDSTAQAYVEVTKSGAN